MNAATNDARVGNALCRRAPLWQSAIRAPFVAPSTLVHRLRAAMKKGRREGAVPTAAEAPVVTDERFAVVQSDPRFKRFPKVRVLHRGLTCASKLLV